VYASIGALLLGGVFLLAGALKIKHPEGAAGPLRSYGVPNSFVAGSSRILAFGELGIASLMVFPQTRVIGAALACGTLAIFTAAITVKLVRGQRTSCGCFGLIHSEIGWPILARNFLLISLALLVISG